MKKIKNTKMPLFLYVLSALQISLIAILITSIFLFDSIQTMNQGAFDIRDFELLITLIVLGVSFILTTRVISEMKISEMKSQINMETIKNMESLNNQMRAQRHDFLNHIQVIYALVEMEEYTEASEYMNKLLGDMENTGRFMKTSDAAVNALLAAKHNDAARRGIIFDINIATRLDKLIISGWELCRILGNLIDNAIYAVEKYAAMSHDGAASDKSLTLSVIERPAGYEFTIENTGEPIDNYLLEKIFLPGFTTKREKGQGMGLYIVKNIVDSNGGSITVSSDADITSFTVRLPRKADV